LELSKELLSLLLPELLVNHFEITAFKTENKDIHISFIENKTTPKEETNRILVGNGFHDELTIQDFPLRGKTVFLHIKRRRWRDKQTGESVHRNWDLVAQGSRMTIDFAALLKAISKY
jgi:hypothetical protein